jgi:hypothetical protein
VFISDRDKGLKAADDKLEDYVIKAIYAYHLINNFTTQYSRTLKPLFWRICHANSKARFEFLINKLQEINNLTTQYLLNSQPKLWAKAHFKRTRFGHNTSNVVKSINKVLKLDQELPIVQVLDSL